MNLRPHHALCIQKFTGHGYDEKFTRHMTRLTRELRARPETQVDIISGCDDLCTHCPSKTSGSCSTLEKVAEMDAAVLAAVGVSVGQSIRWEDLAALAREKVFKTAEFEKICKNCQWYELCLHTRI